MMKHLVFILFTIIGTSCKPQNPSVSENSSSVKDSLSSSKPIVTAFDKDTQTIHVMVALCDNENQGIVPVPKAIGKGDDPHNNLYWGTAYGVKTYFKRSGEWTLLKSYAVDSIILERLIFKHKTKNTYLVADAYDGRYIKKTTTDFLQSTAGLMKDTLQVGKKTIGIEGNAKLLSYIGHDGLMDFQLDEVYENADNQVRDVIILACYSRHFFEPKIKEAGAQSVLWSTGLMSPEAYTLHDALSAYIQNSDKPTIREKAAQAYHKYQKCGINAARRLLVND